jgi:hypothetical protein
MVYAADSKSAARKGLRVQVSSPALSRIVRAIGAAREQVNRQGSWPRAYQPHTKVSVAADLPPKRPSSGFERTRYPARPMDARAAGIVGVALLSVACGHRSGDDARRIDQASPPAAGAAVFGDLVRSMPVCAEGQPSITVEEAFARRWTPAECLVIEGELVLDSTPGVCGSIGREASDLCPAVWSLLGRSAKSAPALRLPGVPRHRPDPHTLILSNHRGFLYAVECRHDFLGYCDEDDAGRPRMPSGARFHLSQAFRDRSAPSQSPDIPGVRVAILGAVHDPCAAYPGDARQVAEAQCADAYAREVALTPAYGFDMARICRIE